MSTSAFKYLLLPTLQLLVLLGTQLAEAAKPGGGTTPPPSNTTVLFDTTVNPGIDVWYRETRGINPDGTGSKLAFQHRLDLSPVPSARVYGADNVLSRLWLVIDKVPVNYNGVDYMANEIFACRLDGNGGVQRIQLTAFFPHVTFAIGSGYVTRLNWSNDGNDSFFAFLGRMYGTDGDTAVTPSAERDLSDDRCHIFQISLRGTDLQLLLDSGIEPRFTVADVYAGTMIRPVLTISAPVDGNMNDLAFHDWSPDGTQIVYSTSSGIWIAELHADRSVVHETDTLDRFLLINSVFSFPRWSPDGTRIAFSEVGYVYTIRTDGTDLKTVLSRTPNDWFSVPIWSPDSQFLAVNHRRISKGWDWVYDLSRVPAGGGNYTVLYKGDIYGEKRPMGWYRNLTP